ncbi:hypothetical protein Trco_001628 [Trichoderma cornu-damae]|uniref:Uncharacterized protein n=1 Tax=Trichoderma cornu-damae TaxID=654480 RepID=A0A9P8QZE4_9HYPO|nr:hypothetical protein Trco_001628 [Trichoderma cornu-damae]
MSSTFMPLLRNPPICRSLVAKSCPPMAHVSSISFILAFAATAVFFFSLSSFWRSYSSRLLTILQTANLAGVSFSELAGTQRALRAPVINHHDLGVGDLVIPRRTISAGAINVTLGGKPAVISTLLLVVGILRGRRTRRGFVPALVAGTCDDNKLCLEASQFILEATGRERKNLAESQIHRAVTMTDCFVNK